jgi:threonine synthase
MDRFLGTDFLTVAAEDAPELVDLEHQFRQNLRADPSALAFSSFDLGGTPEFARVAEFGFVSGASSHARRLQTIRDTERRYGLVVDTHTADGLAVAADLREPGVPMVCLETALPAKFAETIREALGRDPERPAAYAGIESRAQASYSAST